MIISNIKYQNANFNKLRAKARRKAKGIFTPREKDLKSTSLNILKVGAVMATLRINAVSLRLIL